MNKESTYKTNVQRHNKSLRASIPRPILDYTGLGRGRKANVNITNTQGPALDASPFQVTLTDNNGSVVFTIPQAVASYLGVTVGDEVEVKIAAPGKDG